MTEYRLVGSAVVDGARSRVFFHVRPDVEPYQWGTLDDLFYKKCLERNYRAPVLIDWSIA